MREDNKSAVGLAKPFPTRTHIRLAKDSDYVMEKDAPAISGAEPWTASKMEASLTIFLMTETGCYYDRYTYTSNISRRSETQTADKTGAHIG